MSFRLVDSGWNSVLTDAAKKDQSHWRLVCPFIKGGTVKRLLANGKPDSLQVITRFDLNDFAQGVSDLAALRLLIEHKGQVRGVKNLHAKLYLFGDSQAIVTSANLTRAGLDRNHEFGFESENAEVFKNCLAYFNELWGKSGENLTLELLDEWEEIVSARLSSGLTPELVTGLPDFGADVGLAPTPTDLPIAVAEASQAFVKFFGHNENRAIRSMKVFDAIDEAGCHWTCTFPNGRRPRQIKDGAILFMGRMVKDPNDILIFGRGIGTRYREGIDDATEEDIARRPWMEKWPHFVRVHSTEFMEGRLQNGISLNKLMRALKSDSFRSTQRNALKGRGNVDPRAAYKQKAYVGLTSLGNTWLNEQLQEAFNRYGTIQPAILDQLDWPGT